MLVLKQWSVLFPLQLSDRLRHSEGQFTEAGVSGAGQEPDWLKQLRVRYHSLQVGLQNHRFCFNSNHNCLDEAKILSWDLLNWDL